MAVLVAAAILVATLVPLKQRTIRPLRSLRQQRPRLRQIVRTTRRRWPPAAEDQQAEYARYS